MVFINFLALLWIGYFSSAGSHSTDVLSQSPPLYLHNIIRPQLLSSYWFMFYYCSSYNYYYHRASFFDLKKKRKHFFRSSEHWEKEKKTIIPLNVLCHANPVMRLKDSLQFDDFFYIISFDQKSTLLAPLRPQLNGFSLPCAYSYLTYYNLKNFFVYVSFQFKQLLPRKVKAWKKKIIQINVISLITLRTHKNYWKKRLCIALFVARDFKKKPRELRMWQWSLSSKKVRAEFYVTTYIYTTTTLIFRPTKSY